MIIAVAAVSSPMPTGHRTRFQTVLAVLPPNEDAIAFPSPRAANASTARSPAVSVSSSARPYFRSDGRSCSMPYSRFSARSI